MVSPYIKELVEETGKTEKEITRYWESAKIIVSEELQVELEDFTKKEYAYTKDLVYKMFGLDEKFGVAEFIKSNKSADEFIEEAVQSSDSFGINKTIQKKKKEEPKPEKKEELTPEEIEEQKIFSGQIEIDDKLIEEMEKDL